MKSPRDFRPLSAAALGLLALLCWSGAALAEVHARLDRPEVYEGDTLTLTIEAEGAGGSGEPDLSVLGDDFDLLGTSQGTSISIINGRQSARRTWSVTLAPKTLGRVEIPPIRVGSEQTQPLTLRVSQVPDHADGGPGDDVFVEVELGIDGDTVMVQQQVPVVVRLYSALPLRGGDLSDPRADGAVLERLGPDSQYSTERNGREYQVIERRFSLSPERSGGLRIAPVVFEGEVRAQSGRSGLPSRRFGSLFDDPMIERMLGDNPFSMLERGEPVRARSDALTLHVEPRPAGFGGGHWLPAQALAIKDSWASGTPDLTVGEPATRTLTITAKGLSGTQIPELEPPAPAGARVYSEDTETQSRTDGATLYGVSVQRITVIPTAGGTLELPEIRVPWWDTEAEKERVATVPALTLTVTGAPAPEPDKTQESGTREAEPAPSPSPAPAPAPDAAGAAPAAAAAGEEPTDRDWAIWGAGAALVVALAALGAVLWRRRRQSTSTGSASIDTPAPGRAPRAMAGRHRDALHAACTGNDAAAAARALIAWAQAVWPAAAPANLSGIAALLEAEGGARQREAAEQVRMLERRLYAPGGGPWDGEPLWRALKDGLGGGDHARSEREDDLAPLYPYRV